MSLAFQWLVMPFIAFHLISALNAADIHKDAWATMRHTLMACYAFAVMLAAAA